MCSHRKSKQIKRRRVRSVLKKKAMGLLLSFVTIIRIYIDRFIDYLFSFYYTSERQYITKPQNSLVLESATSLARKIREKSVTSEEVVRAFLERVKEVDPVVNAVVDSRFDDAIKEAKEVDRSITNGKITEETFNEKPFLGVPFTTKETTACKGMKHTFGLLCRKNKVAEEDADVVMLLKKAGGILIGVTNIPQLNMWQETSNPVFGITNNPYDSTRNVGGSSGGEAAIIAACGSPFGIGSDIGGSIRIPAFMCGLFGHKPSNELLSTKGLTYRTGKEGSTMVTAGTLTKYAEDIIPFLKVLLGDKINQLKLNENVNVKDLQVYYMLDCGDPKISPIGNEMQKIITRTINYFEETSNKPPQKLELPHIKYGGKLWRYWMTQEKNVNFRKDLTDRQGEVSPYVEILKFLARRTEYTAAAISVLINQLLPKENEKWARKLTTELREELTEKLGDNGVLLYPSAPWSARYHHTALLRPWNFFYFAVWNALKLPVTQVPLGLDSEGLPVGIQVVAAPSQDHLCIAVAKELEKAFGVWNALKMPVTQVPLGLDSEGLPVGIQVVGGPYQDHLCIAVAKELEKVFGGYVPPFSLKK